ncbi:zinc metalloproteinase nas-1-like [Lineus longissimus]|uniref:zinc metalloproteinase nas-1-like n=1 Tax=Lineus longissimus TaxID=88925 RepID=UPI002B4C45EE
MARYLLLCLIGIWLVATVSSGLVRHDSKKRDPPANNSPEMTGNVADLSKEKDKTYTVNGHKVFRYNDVEIDENVVKELFDKGRQRSTSGETQRQKRAAIVSDKKKRWPRIALVPYEIVTADFNEAQIKDIIATFAFLETETCIAFREKTNNDVNYVKIADCGDGCWAHLGKMDGPNWQKVCLGDGCKWPGLYAHELGHTLGLQHEHQRPDRDDKIFIHPENIRNGSEDAFEKFKADSVLTTRYDFASAMHYERTSFANPGTNTITAKKDWNNEKLGGVWWKMYSYHDVRLLNRAYGCNAFCKDVECERGYVNKDCKCVTFEEYYATYCKNEYWNDDQCDGWASTGECQKNPGWMYFRCKKSCKACYNDPKPTKADD